MRRSEGYLAEAQRLTHTASWAWRVEGREALHLSEESFRIWGFDPKEGFPARAMLRCVCFPFGTFNCGALNLFHRTGKLSGAAWS